MISLLFFLLALVFALLAFDARSLGDGKGRGLDPDLAKRWGIAVSHLPLDQQARLDSDLQTYVAPRRGWAGAFALLALGFAVVALLALFWG